MEQTDHKNIDAIAAAWVVREGGGPLAEPERAERDRWLAASSRHLGAYARAHAVLVWSGRMSAPAPARSRLRCWRLGAAAALLAVVAGALVWAWPQGTIHQTARGEILRVSLADGSVLTLDTNSRVRARMGPDRRELQLLSGTALFDVVGDPERPFTVDADGTRVTAIGTRFSVSLDRRAGSGIGPVEVLVSEGVVDVAESGPDDPVPARLHAGMRALARPAAGVEVSQVNAQELDRRLLWREGMLAFNGDTLSVAAARFRRYSDIPIIIDDPRVGSRRVMGLYPANDPAGFARNVALSLGLEVETVRGGVRLWAPTVAEGAVAGPELQ